MSDDVAAPDQFVLPEGFEQLDWRRGFMRQIGPLYRRAAAGRSLMGFRVEENHVNGIGNAHGGMLMSFADMAWGHVISIERSAHWVTVRLQCDFLSGAGPGEWVEGAGETLSIDGDLFTVRGRVWCGERTLVTGMGIFKAMKSRPPRPGEKAYVDGA